MGTVGPWRDCRQLLVAGTTLVPPSAVPPPEWSPQTKILHGPRGLYCVLGYPTAHSVDAGKVLMEALKDKDVKADAVRISMSKLGQEGVEAAQASLI